MIVKDFIAQWPNLVPREFCNFLIENFNSADEIQKNIFSAKVFSKDSSKPIAEGRKDFSYVLNYHNEHAPEVYKYLQIAYQDYINEFELLNDAKLFPSEIKMQKTPPGGGYHVWHYENSGWEVSHRELTWMIYLNDLPDGEGETEFLFQKCRIKPTTGTLLIWPAGFTHPHRGNTVFTTDKYIITGWFNKIP
jgi:hypothetical protein